jgi:hypothetical protein
MYEILQLLDMAGSYPNILPLCRLWYEEKDSPEVEKPPLGGELSFLAIFFQCIPFFITVICWNIGEIE